MKTKQTSALNAQTPRRQFFQDAGKLAGALALAGVMLPKLASGGEESQAKEIKDDVAPFTNIAFRHKPTDGRTEWMDVSFCCSRQLTRIEIVDKYILARSLFYLGHRNEEIVERLREV